MPEGAGDVDEPQSELRFRAAQLLKKRLKLGEEVRALRPLRSLAKKVSFPASEPSLCTTADTCNSCWPGAHSSSQLSSEFTAASDTLAACANGQFLWDITFCEWILKADWLVEAIGHYIPCSLCEAAEHGNTNLGAQSDQERGVSASNGRPHQLEGHWGKVGPLLSPELRATDLDSIWLLACQQAGSYLTQWSPDCGVKGLTQFGADGLRP